MKCQGVSEGIGIGNLLVLKPKAEIRETFADNPKTEIIKLEEALNKGLIELEVLYKSKLEILGEEKARIFQAHIMILQDPEWLQDIKKSILTSGWSTEYAVFSATERMAQLFEKMDNQYFQERAYDIRDVGNRVLRILSGGEEIDLSNVPDGTIIAAEDLTPSDTALLTPKNVAGIITAIGGSTSHSAIIARTLGIPAVMGIGREALLELNNLETAIVDGTVGNIIINPKEDTLSDYKKRLQNIYADNEFYKTFIGRTSRTLDGKSIELSANIATPKDVNSVIENDAEGVGLFRSEFLFMNRNTPPTEEEQLETYKEVLEGLGERPVIIRTMDIGGDKEVPYLKMPKEMNPFLGYRAIRYCLREKGIFITQLRAIFRAGIYGNPQIMVPMISSLKEVREVKNIIEEVKASLTEEEIPFKKDIPLGIMIEIPSAALCSDVLAKEVDFFSIGTNDLVQYTLAVDRMNENITDLYTYYHPAVLRLIKMTIDSGHKEGIWVGMCGSAAGDLTIMPLLLGMGLDEFSMSPNMILKARKRVLEIDSYKASLEVERLLNLESAEEIKKELEELYPEN